MNYQAKFAAPFGMLGIRCEADKLTGIEFIAPDSKPQPPADAFTRTVREQLLAYFSDPSFCFDIPLKLNGTAHQHKVWQAMCTIPRGQTRYYGDIALQLDSSPRAVGQACGANPVPIIIPCHRVVSKSGMGGFMHQRGGAALDTKRWLLAHEAITPSPPTPLPRGERGGIKAPSLLGGIKAPSPLMGEGWGEGGDMESSFLRFSKRQVR